MPATYSQKIYIPNSYYHIYNQGVDKRTIFQDEEDYAVFLGYLATYLTPKDEKALKEQLADSTRTTKEKDKILKLMRMNNFHSEITLLAYCLMPDHFHLFVKQKTKSSLDTFMNSLSTRYAMYFNRKYKRTGHLFQGVYKAVSVETQADLLHLSAYIHRNPLSLHTADAMAKQPSSYAQYLGTRHEPWVQPEEILSHFYQTNPTVSYAAFVDSSTDYTHIEEVTIDNHKWITTEAIARATPEKTEKSSFFKRLFDM